MVQMIGLLLWIFSNKPVKASHNCLICGVDTGGLFYCIVVHYGFLLVFCELHRDCSFLLDVSFFCSVFTDCFDCAFALASLSMMEW